MYSKEIKRKPGKSRPDGMILRAPVLDQFPWLIHGFSTRRGGVSSFDGRRSRGADLNLGNGTGDSPQHVSHNRRRLLDRLPAKGMQLVLQRQIHSDLIRHLDGAVRPAALPAGDALITRRPGLLLGVLTADCLPILLVDPRQRVVAALHCGWRGTVRRLAEKAVGRLRFLFGSQPQDLWAAIGPGIRSCCYTVGPEVVDEISSQFCYSESLFLTRSRPLTPLETKRFVMILPLRSNFGPRTVKEIHLDLAHANLRQLQDAGLPANQIASDSPCTSCRPDLFFSHRRDGGHTGRMMGVIGIRKNAGNPERETSP